ncbi:hypothetical protein LWI28_002533 [Acer negundo]|uniref:IRK-interacting protein n=1 Tax=Acer negundo TaxID=4023 RepID=A0AAD5JD13_ACENE|nr:hypothetical protein LWI28_002533 [Acer negundo]KAK4856198.1 hypothetical protein QYF36_015065 [Acer negundo]
MAAVSTAAQIFQDHNSVNNNNNNNEVSRHEIQAAIAKAVELRALHAALMQGNSPANSRYPSSSPVSRPVPHFSAQDYPVFTPSYEDETLPGYHQISSNNQSGSWDEFGIEGGNSSETALSDYNKKENLSSSKKGLPSGFAGLESHICPAEDQKSVTSSCTNHITVLQASPGTEFYKSSRRNSLGDFKSLSSCNRCKPAVITAESESENVISRNIRSSNIVVPLTDSHLSVQSQPKSSRGGVISWLFPRLKKKHNKNENSPNRTDQSEEVSQIFKDLGILSIETLKRELIEANENRDAALMEVSEMKSSLGELKQKLEYLESYCEELKKALRQAKDPQVHEKLGNFPWRGKSIDGNGDSMPVSEEVMVEGFLQIVSEARLSVKHFCKTLVGQIEEADNTLMDNLNMLLQPYKLSLTSKYSKAVFYHLEAIINQSLYQDFENSVFQKNGTPKLLDPQQDRQGQFSSFVALRNLSWNEVLRKGTKYYSEEFSKFCDQKMSCIITTLNWTRPWPEQLLQAFFVAAKCIWLLHLLAFSFNPVLGILRVEENRSFDPHYMEDMFMDRQKSSGPSRVKIMVMPGFYVQDRVLRCKVLCRYKSVA